MERTQETQVRLEAVRFAESPHAGAFGDLGKPVLIDAISRFLLACYADAGTAPQKLDADVAREVILTHLPRRCGPKEPFVPRMDAIFRAFFAHLEDTALVPQLFEIRRMLDEIDGHFEKAVRAVPDAERRLDDTPSAPIRRPSEKVGRNDPCPCGSGKKYKQCCFKLGSG